jgi:hypothetical protein
LIDCGGFKGGSSNGKTRSEALSWSLVPFPAPDPLGGMDRLKQTHWHALLLRACADIPLDDGSAHLNETVIDAPDRRLISFDKAREIRSIIFEIYDA